MATNVSPAPASSFDVQGAWSAVWAMAVTVAALITAELLPISLLTPMASDLGISEGLAGQTIGVTAIAALVTSLLVVAVSGRMDRRTLLLLLTGVLIVSNLIVALAPGIVMLLVGRALLGIALGGFWAIATATAMRLVPAARVPAALGIVFGGNAVASVIAAPVGSFLGDLIGWRGVFLAIVPLGVLALIWQLATLPSMPPRGEARVSTLFRLFGRPQVGVGMVAVILLFTGHFAFLTYLRPYLDDVTGDNVTLLSAILFTYGIGGLVGTTFLGPQVGRRLYPALTAIPLFLCLFALVLIVGQNALWVTLIVIPLWSLVGSSGPVGWSTWVARAIPDETESGGGMLVASIQFAITLGALVGGLLFDAYGTTGAFAASAVVLAAGAMILLVNGRVQARSAS